MAGTQGAKHEQTRLPALCSLRFAVALCSLFFAIAVLILLFAPSREKYQSTRFPDEPEMLLHG
jgi:hypothetical protein